MQSPLVSIIVPTYNQQNDYFRQCLDSILAQTYPNIEIIVSDNHSTNDVPQVLSEYSDKRLKIVKPPEHLPITPHFHWAAEQATGDYISFLCSDDWIEPTCIAELVNLIQPNPSVSMAFCNAKFVIEGKIHNNPYLKNEIVPSDIAFQDYIQFKKVKGNLYGDIFRHDVYKKIGGIGNGNMAFAADKWLMIQVAAQGDVAYSEKPLAVYRIDNPIRGSRIVTYINDTINLYRLIERYYLDKVKGGIRTINREKRIMAYEFLGAIPKNLQKNDITDSQFNEALSHIKKLTDSSIIHFICNHFEQRKGIKFYNFCYFLWAKGRNLIQKLSFVV